MSDLSSAPESGGSEAATVITLANDAPSEMSAREAGRALSEWRKTKSKEPAPALVAAVEAMPPAAPPEQNELASDEADAAPPESEVPSEATEANEPAEVQPLIDPPRSWTKDAKEKWQSLPRETQEYLSGREQERDREVRRSQNETAEKLKGLTAKEQAVEKARQEYEAKLPALLQALRDANSASFGDIKTIEDVQKLQLNDPFRFQEWQVHQMKLQAATAEDNEVKARHDTEKQTNWQKLVADENAKFVERVPEFADKAKAKELTTKAVDRLNDLGFTDSELAELASGKERLSVYDHRIQLLLVDSLKLAEIQKAKTAAVTKLTPKVQRPGTARPTGQSAVQDVQALEKKLANATGLNAMRLGAELIKAQRRASTR